MFAGWIYDLIGLFFPRICAGCGNNLWRYEKTICNSCDYHLPRTNFHLDTENPITLLFTGRAEIVHGAAFLFFNKGGKVQHLMHLLKYKGRTDIGLFIGNQYGHHLMQDLRYSTCDLIIPVPLHKNKLKKRGYNQSEQFAIGLSETMKIPVMTDVLVRNVPNETQTRKSRYNRYLNVQEIFTVKKPGLITGKKVLLVDDVITTGATLEACILSLNKTSGTKVLVTCMAIASG
jgi:ComF family protein